MALAWGVYTPALEGPFFYDDYQNIVDNPNLDPTRGWAAAAFDAPTLRPVANLSFAWNRRLTGLDARGFRAVNVALHALASLAVAGLARRLIPRISPGLDARSATVCALLSGLLFALHPVQTQAVSYVVQRMASLSTLFYVSSCLAWLRGREAEAGGRVAWWCAAGLLWSLALGSKEIAITLPGALWLIEWLGFRRGDPRFLRRSAIGLGLPALVGLGALCVWLWAEEAYAGRGFSAGERLWTALRVQWLYASLVALPLPSRLNLLHELELSRSLLEPPRTLLAGLGIVTVAGVGVAARRSAPWLGFAVAWWALHMALESFLLPLALVYEHRLYLPMVGVAAAVPAAAASALPRARPVLAPLALLALAGLGLATAQRNAVWGDELALWADTARKSPGVAAARGNHGLALARAGRLPEAVSEYRAALAIDPEDAEAINNLGSALLALGQRHEALLHFQRAVDAQPDHARARFNLGMLLAEDGAHRAGLAHVEAALRLQPHDASIWNGLGAIRVWQGRPEAGAQAFERALALDPGHADARRNLARLRGAYSP